jgi:predicted acetyltransferase
VDNAAARKCIEKNRGILLDTVESITPGRRGTEIERYWISFR